MDRRLLTITLMAFALTAMLFANQTAREAAAAQGLQVPPVERTPQIERDLGTLRERLRAQFLGSTPKIQGILRECQDDGTFASVDYHDANRSTWLAFRHLELTATLARAYANPDSPFHHDERTAHAITAAFAWWTKHKPRNPNWWWNEIALPGALTRILLLTPELIAPEDFQTALELCRKVSLKNYTGQNLVDGAILVLQRGLVEDDASVVTAAANVIHSEIRLSPPPGTHGALEGIRADGCYHQHGPQIQFGGYGLNFLNCTATWATNWQGTAWQLAENEWDILRHLVFDGYQWVLWNGRMDLLVGGRHMRGDTGHSKGNVVLGCLNRFADADATAAPRYRQVIQRNQPDHPNDLLGAKWFWNSDLMVHRRPAWMAVLRACSTRVHPMEDNINQDCALGRYFADGTLLIYRHGDEYLEMPAVWDWTRLPGTTLPATPVTSTKRQRFTLSPTGSRLRGATAFVGGVTDGQPACAIYTQNLDGVRVKKAYFFDDEVIYELGTDLCSTSPHPVATTLNSCRLNGEVLQGHRWAHHDGIGYVADAPIAVTAADRTGDERILHGGIREETLKTLPVFHAQIDHGIQPQDASYCVAILPDATPARTAAFQFNAVLANTTDLQAVRLADGTVAAVFHAPGALGNFATDAPGVFLIRDNTVFAADPTQQLATMTLALDGRPRAVTLPAGDLAGTTATINF